MGKQKPPLSPNRIIAHNLRQARELRGWTQEEASAQLEPYMGVRWSRASFSAAERGIDTLKVREFNADEIAAFALAFDLPVLWFFIPPDNSLDIITSDQSNPQNPGEFIDLIVGRPQVSDALMARIEQVLGSLPEDRRSELHRAILNIVVGPAAFLIAKEIGDVETLARRLEQLAAEQKELAGAIREARAKWMAKVSAGEADRRSG